MGRLYVICYSKHTVDIRPIGVRSGNSMGDTAFIFSAGSAYFCKLGRYLGQELGRFDRKRCLSTVLFHDNCQMKYMRHVYVSNRQEQHI
jgi:hypothetical protein